MTRYSSSSLAIHHLICTLTLYRYSPLSFERAFFEKEKVIRIQPPITLLFLYFYPQNLTSTSIHKPANFARKKPDLILRFFFWQSIKQKTPHCCGREKCLYAFFVLRKPYSSFNRVPLEWFNSLWGYLNNNHYCIKIKSF